MSGELLAEVDTSVANLAAVVADPARLCELLVLHLNMMSCRAKLAAPNPVVNIDIGSATSNSSFSRMAMEYRYLLTRSDDFVDMNLTSASGPLGTKEYEFDVQALALPGDRSLLRMTYSYRYGFTAKMSMDLYAKATGRQRVGFSVTGQAADGQPVYVGGMMGSVERNLMRYYLAIVAYASVPGAVGAPVFEQRLRECYRLTDRYPKQLREVGLNEYLALKQRPPAQP